MNYLAHGYQFLDRPLFLAGTAVPDWLSVVDRRVRARKKLVEPIVDSAACHNLKEVGNGILQHHQDDDTFHRSVIFQQLEARLCKSFRTLMPDPFDHRPGFLGHIVVELMLDAALIERHNSLLDDYYRAMDFVNEQFIEDAVNQMVSRKTDRLAWFIGRFRAERFLYDYMDDRRMLTRLNQVMRRVTLPQMNSDVVAILSEARSMVLNNMDDLLNHSQLVLPNEANAP